MGFVFDEPSKIDYQYNHLFFVIPQRVIHIYLVNGMLCSFLGRADIMTPTGKRLDSYKRNEDGRLRTKTASTS